MMPVVRAKPFASWGMKKSSLDVILYRGAVKSLIPIILVRTNKTANELAKTRYSPSDLGYSFFSRYIIQLSAFLVVNNRVFNDSKRILR